MNPLTPKDIVMCFLCGLAGGVAALMGKAFLC